MALALTIGSLTSVTSLPASNYQMQIGLNDVAAGVRIGKLIEKAKKNFEKGNLKDLIDNMLDLKSRYSAVLREGYPKHPRLCI